MQSASRLLPRCAASIAGLVVLIAFAGLWLSGAQSTYDQLLSAWGMHPFEYPFVDVDGSLAAWDCARKGVDVIVSDPCDYLRRGYSYSPFWMTIDWIPLGRPDRVAVGFLLAIAFLVSLSALPPPLSRAETELRIASVLSTMVVFAVERANPDMLLFILVILMLSLLSRSSIARVFGYGIAFLAGLIKYYPFILLGLIVRERLRVLVPLALVSFIGLVLFYQIYAAEILEGVPHIASGSSFGDMFGAKNFPAGMLGVFRHIMISPAIATAAALTASILLLAVVAWTMTRLQRASDIPAALVRLDEPRRLALLAGALLLVGCFFAGRSVGYRGIFLLLVLPGLFALGQDKDTGAAATAARLAAMSIAPLMWAEALRLWVHIAVMGEMDPSDYPTVVEQPLDFLTWCAREVAWWFLVGFLLTLLLGFVANSPLFQICQRSISARRRA
jgi:hypothetical protein